MKRVRMLFAMMMFLLVGGVVFANPNPPVPPRPPKAPAPPISISIRGGKVQVDGIDRLVASHLAAVQQLLRDNPNIPQDVRDRLVQRMNKVKAIVDRHLKNLDTSDLDRLGDQLEKMGDELEKAMSGLDADLAKLGDKISKDVARKLDKVKDRLKLKLGPLPPPPPPPPGSDPDDHDPDHDGDHDPDVTDPWGHTHDDTVTIDGLKDFALKPAQRDAIAKLRAASDTQVASIKTQLESASKRLEDALADPKVTDVDVTRHVDQISKLEAELRKTKLLTWVQARRVLDADQIKRLEAASRKSP
jgi:DNA gyrase/topoisomerase IV subunit A